MQSSQPIVVAILCTLLLVAALGTAVLAVWALRRPKRAAQPDAPALPIEPAPVVSPTPAEAPPAQGPMPYAATRTLLTSAEQSFFHALRAAVPAELLICPQVRLANLVHTTSRNKQQTKYDFYRIQAKCVDFVLCDAGTTAPRLVIELDDASHSRSDRQARDAFVDAVLAQVRLPILHVPWQRSYDSQQLGAAIQARLQLPPAPAATPAKQVAGPEQRNGWLTPIAAAPAAETRHAPHEARYACGHCQCELRKDAKFCSHCGAVL